MYELVEVKRNEVFTNSWIVAEGTNNAHRSIIAIIDKYSDDFKEFGKLSNHLKYLEVTKNKTKVYDLNEEQATFLITMLRNNKIVVEFKKNLVKQFYAMRRHLIEIQSNSWIETREISKQNRLKETDVIKQLVEYAKSQGSTHSDKLYITYTKLANSIINSKRDHASTMELNNLTLIESIILQTIKIDMSIGMQYKEIFQDCKGRIETFKDITYMNSNKKLS